MISVMWQLKPIRILGVHNEDIQGASRLYSVRGVRVGVYERGGLNDDG